MKTNVATLLLSFFLSTFVNAQNKNKTWVIRANVGASLSISNVSLEKAFAKRHSLSIIPAYGFLRSEKATYKAYGIGLDYKYYLSSQSFAPQGFYALTGGSMAQGRANIETTGKTADIKGYTLHAEGGKQWIFKKGFTIDAHLGLQYINLNGKSDGYDFPFAGWLPAFGAGIGYAF